MLRHAIPTSFVSRTLETSPRSPIAALQNRGFFYGAIYCAALLISLVLYAPTLDGFFIKDDLNILLMTAPPYKWTVWDAVAPFNNGFWRPTHQVVSHYMTRFFGHEPFPYHLLCLLIHAGVVTMGTVLVVSVLRQPAWVGVLCALLMTTHIGTLAACVQYSYAFDSWMALASLIALAGWDRWLEQRSWAWLLLAAAGLTFACLTKETAMLLPLIMIVWSFGRGSRSRSNLFKARLILLLACVALVAMVLTAQQRVSISYVRTGHLQVGPQVVLRQFADYTSAMWLPYLHLLDWPWKHISLPHSFVWGIRISTLVLLGIAFVCYLRRPRHYFPLFFVLAAALLLVPPSAVSWGPRLWYAYTSAIYVSIFFALTLASTRGRVRIGVGAIVFLLWLTFLPGFWHSGSVRRYLRISGGTKALVQEMNALAPGWKPDANIAVFGHPHPGTLEIRPIDANNITKLFVSSRRITVELDAVTSLTDHAYWFHDGRLLPLHLEQLKTTGIPAAILSEGAPQDWQ